jgi:hypothetical protein
VAWGPGSAREFGCSCAIPDVSETKRRKDNADRLILPLERRFFGRGVSEIHPQALVDREALALDAGYCISEGRVPGADGEHSIEYEHSEETCVTLAEENEDGESITQEQAPVYG